MGDRKKSPSKAFGKVLKELRVARGLTQEALALDVETERSHISSLERGEKGPSLGTIIRLAKGLGISAGELMSQVELKLADKRR